MTFDITIDSTNEPVQQDETLTVDCTVTNNGGSTATKDIDLNILEPVTRVDDFESYALGDDETTVSTWGGDDFVIGNTNVAEGAQTLEIGGSDVDILTSYEGDGLNYYPGEEPVRCLVHWPGGSNFDVSVAVPTSAPTNNEDCYRVRVLADGGETWLRKTQNDNSTVVDSTTSPPGGEWLDVCIDRETVNGEVQLDAAIWAWHSNTSTWEQDVVLSGVDTDAYWDDTNRGVGLNQWNAAETVSFDHFRVGDPPSEPPRFAPGNF